MTSRLIPETLRIVSGGPYQKPALPWNPVFRSPLHPLAVRLREKYRLLEAAGEGDVFERARRLKIWVRSRWDHGWDNEGQQDSLDILARADRGGRFNCPYYSRTLVQCCLAVGIPARQMGVHRKNADFPDGIVSNAGHAVSEAYCRELRKWVMLDADANAFYLIGGMPANCLDVHRAWLKDRAGKVRQVRDKPHFATPARCPVVSDRYLRRVWKDFTRHETRDYYHHVNTNLVNGYAQPPVRSPQRLIWFAGATPPLLASAYGGLDFAGNAFVAEEKDFNWALDQTFIQARMLGTSPSNRIEIRLENNMPFFDHYEIRVADKPFSRLKTDHCVLDLPAGRSMTRARCVDCFGKAGEEASLALELRPASKAILKLRNQKYWL